jgi:hypothetical protein
MGSDTAVLAREGDRDSGRAGRHRPAGPQTDHPLLALQRSVGNQTVLKLLSRAQAKLQVGAADDPYEREADSVAQRVLAVIRSGSSSGPADDADQMSAAPAASVHRMAVVGAEGGDLDSSTESALRSEVGRGRPLGGSLRNSMESAFGSDFSHVRLHDDSRSVQLNRQVQAKAFTVGSDIFFGAGSSPSNPELLAHELTHVIQQGGRRA